MENVFSIRDDKHIAFSLAWRIMLVNGGSNYNINGYGVALDLWFGMKQLMNGKFVPPTYEWKMYYKLVYFARDGKMSVEA